MNKNKIILSTLLLSLLFSCTSKKQVFVDPLAAHIDSSIAPGDNFFLFANNNWFKQNPIPNTESNNGIFRTIEDTINSQILNLCIAATKADAPKGSNKQKIGDLYASGMDTVTIDKQGISGIKPELDMIQSMASKSELVDVVAALNQIGVNPFFGFGVSKDEKNSSKYALILNQGGLGLPERDYYFSEKELNIRNEYVKFITVLLNKVGVADANTQAQAILKLETALAKASKKLEDLRDPYLNYNKLNVKAVNSFTPSFVWSDYVNKRGLKNADTIIVGQTEFIKSLNSIINETDLAVIKNYMIVQTMNTFASYMSSDIEKLNFYFYETVLSGVKVQKPRWKRVVETTNQLLGELIGQVYVKEYIPAGTKEKLIEIGRAVQDVYGKRILANTWMTDSTKKKAIHKLTFMNFKMGFPDVWKDLSSIQISKNNYLENIKSCYRWQVSYNMNKFGKPVDRQEWEMYPQTYNAYYDPTNNEIVIPACNIIVPGFEGRMPDDAVLYGIIGGSTIGHEITHGFDDQGSQYNTEGNLSNWWTEQDKQQFKLRTQKIVEQYNNYKALDSFALNGDATQGENIADLGGVLMGYLAFKRTAQGHDTTKIGGYTPDQRYFLAFAYSWMVQKTKASIKKQVKVDVHSPAEFRILGPLSNTDAFYEAFNIQPINKMYRKESERVVIW